MKQVQQIRSYVLFSILIAFIAGLTACATTPTAAAAKVADADESMVTGCRFLGEVQGSSGWGNLAASAGMENAKNEARENAAKLSATDIVWRSISGGYSPYVNGRAYLCGNRP
jgi:hypothetical protein